MMSAVEQAIHAIELARRGYDLTGVDLSESMLNRAREKAEESEIKVNFIQADARNLPFENEFDLAIMLCEGGFPLMETDVTNFEILKQVTRALKSGAKFIFTTLNGLFPLFHSVKEFKGTTEAGGPEFGQSNTFDVMTFRDYNLTSLEDDSGQIIEVESNERYYVPSEITWLLKSLGYSRIDICGAKLGAFSGQNKLTFEDFEMLVITHKPD